jgi:hypothetical protein
VKTGRIEVKPPISLSSELVFSQGQYRKLDGGKKVRMKLAPNVYCTGLFSEDHEGEKWARSQKYLKWVDTVSANYRKRAFV